MLKDSNNERCLPNSGPGGMRRHRTSQASTAWSIVLPWLALAGLALALLMGSSSIGMIDQGDYPRTVSRIVAEPLPAPADAAPGAPVTRWSLPEGLPRPNPSSGTPSFLFAGAAMVQSTYQDHFDLPQLALAAKLSWILSLGLLAVSLGRRWGVGHTGQALLAAVLMAVSFASHNVAFLQSLYGEFSFVLGLPVLLSALLWPEGRLRALLLLAGLVLCGGAKAQFFYLPLLVLPLVWLQARVTHQRAGTATLAAIVLAQLICLAPLLVSDVMGFNRHHSTYLGSYLAMSEGERDRLGLDPAERACIGVDSWGNRLASVAATQAVPGQHPCPGARDKTFLDTLRPYALAPGAAVRLATEGLPPHLTVAYFHIDKAQRYVVPLRSNPGTVASWLHRLTDARDAVLRPWAVVALLIAGVATAAGSVRRQTAVSGAMLLLALVFLSQVVVSLLGEGVRDLSKHLAGAQYSLDLLAVLTVGMLAARVHRPRAGPPGGGAAAAPPP